MTAKTSKKLVISACVVFCCIFLAGHSIAPRAEAQAKQTEKPEDPYKYSSVLVEAFVVEVKLSALYDLGVSPIGKRPHSASIDDILKCLQGKDSAQVRAGLKLVLWQNNDAATRTTETIYVERQKPAESTPRPRAAPRSGSYSKNFERYEIGKTFNARAGARPDSRIWVDFTFSESGPTNIPPKDDSPIGFINRNWTGTIYLDPGEPGIAGATQNHETAVFLIITADVKHK